MGILMDRRTWIQLACASVATTYGELSSAEQLVVVAHPSVRQASFSKQELSAIFTTRKRNYDEGGRIIALNLPPRSDARVEFDRIVLGMGPDEVARYWIDRKVRGGDPPPKQIPSLNLIAPLVSKLPGAIGYLPASLARNLNVVARLS